MNYLLMSIIGLSISLSASAATYNYRCSAFKSSDDPFLADGYAIVAVSEEGLRFQQFDTATNSPVLLRDYLYVNEGLVGGSGKLKDMIQFRLVEQVKSYGDSLPKLFLEQALIAGGYALRVGGSGGKLTFSGHGFSYDWNLCRRR